MSLHPQSPNYYLAPGPNPGELIEDAEQALREASAILEQYDPIRARIAREDADILRALHHRWGKP